MRGKSLEITLVIGCTGCGKGALGRELAKRLDGEIISVDSMKVYRGMDIGVAKPGVAARDGVVHHLFDVVDPWEEFSVAQFVGMAERIGADIAARGKRIFAVGGTALYIKSLTEGLFEGPSADAEIRKKLAERAEKEGFQALHDELSRIDPEAAGRIHPNDMRRIVRALEVYELTGLPITTLQTQWDRERTKHRCRFVGLRRSLEDQNHRTNMRVKRLIEMGWVDEVKKLLAMERPLSTSAGQALGYPELIQHVRAEITLDEAVEKIKIATRRFAKSQRTWFKRFRDATWIDLNPEDRAADVADRIMEDRTLSCLM